VHTHFLEGLYRRADSSQGRNTYVFNEDFLGGSSSALHTVQNNHIGTGCNSKLGVIVGPGCSHFHVDWFFPVRDFAQLLDLQGEIVRSGPVWVAAGASLVDAFW